ncbi:uncharacterized protein [Montipora capricornis]|uniref:uncharacterized protein n=1 Tax=Montipora capricornis TaxID=246305 RepID=UPI0035F19545
MVSQDQIPPPGDVHYLPHRTDVRRDRDITKVRVFGHILNDYLHFGPSLNPLLFDVLLRFRVHEVASTADIEKAVLNIEIDPEYRDFVRSLWVKDANKETDSALARELLKSLYVDDYVFGGGDVDSAFKLSKEIKLCLKSGGFNMRKWSSYSESLLRSLEQDEAFSDDYEKSNRLRVEEEDKGFSKSVFKQGTEKEQKVWECFGTQPKMN